ncbi:hypothetical protein D9M72_320070 [compost metagenome]
MRQRYKGQDSRQRGQDHWPGTLHRGFDNSVERRQSRALVLVYLPDQDQRVAHQDARQCDQADQGVDAEWLPEQQQGRDYADQSQRAGGKHHDHG